MKYPEHCAVALEFSSPLEGNKVLLHNVLSLLNYFGVWGDTVA